MGEDEEFASIVAQAMQSETPTAKPAEAETPATEPQAEQPKSETPAAEKPAAEQEVTAKTEPEAEKTEEPKPEPKKTDWKAAAAAERQKQAARSAAKTQQSEIQAKLAAAERELAGFRAIKAKAESDPLAAAEEFGLNYERLTKEYIKTLEQNPNQPQVPAEVKQALQKFQEVQGEIHTLREQLAEERRLKVVSGFQADVQSILAAKGDEFELTKTAEEGPALVQAIVAERWKQTAEFNSAGQLIKDGETMATEEACKLAEEYFEGKQLKRFAETKKFKALAGQKPPEVKKPEEKKSSPVTTISQSLRQGGIEHMGSFGNETEELVALVNKHLATPGN